MKSIYLKIACFIAGYQFLILKDYDGYSQRKMGVLAIGMAFPVGIYALDGWLVSRNICQGSVTDAIIASIIAALFIFLLEKAIVMTKVTTGLSIFRISVACGLAFIGAIGLMMDLFRPDVEHQVREMLNKQSGQYYGQVLASHQKEITTLDNSEKMYNSQYQEAFKLALLEPHGTKTTKPGKGPIADWYAKQRDLIKSQNVMPLQAKRDSLNRVMERQAADEAQVQAANVGLMTKVQALFDFSFATGLGKILFCTISGILFGLELMVLALKKGMPKSPFEKDEEDAVELHESRRRKYTNVTYQYTIAK